MSVGYVVRSPHAHARIHKIDKRAAEAAPGVLAVLTAEDACRDGLGTLPSFSFPSSLQGKGYWCPARPVLATDTVRFVGECVAFVVAQDIYAAKDAAELLVVDYEVLPAVAFPVDRGIHVWKEAPDNVSFVLMLGDQAATQMAFARAAHVTKLSQHYPRV